MLLSMTRWVHWLIISTMKLYWIKAITVSFIVVLQVLDHQKHPTNLKVEPFVIVIIIVEELKHTEGFIKVANWLDFYIKIIIVIVIIIELIIVGIAIIINFVIEQVAITIIMEVGLDRLQNLINWPEEEVLVLATQSPIIEEVIGKMVVPIVKRVEFVNVIVKVVKSLRKDLV